MPILYNDKPLYRIKFKDADIREVRKGDELEGGLYFITYNKGIREANVENITQYVGGYPGTEENEFEVTLNLPEDEDVTYGGITASRMATYSQHGFKSSSDGYSYRTYANTGCTDKDCLNYFPAITRDMHTDLLLYCRGTQRQFLYKGVIKNDRYVGDDGGGGGAGDKYPIAPERHTSPLALNGDYYNLNSTAAVLGQCTGYVQGRTAEMRGTTRNDSNFAGAPFGPVSKSFGNAYDGRFNSGHGGHGSYTDDGSNVKVGDVVIFGDGTTAGHVAVVEGKSGNDATLSAFNNPTAGYTATSLGLLPGTAYENFVGPAYKGGDKDGKGAGFLINHTDPVLGEGSGGGGGEAGGVPDPDNPIESYTISNNGDFIICSTSQVAAGSIANGGNSGTQDYPLVPSRYNQAQEDAAPGNHGRKNQRGEPLEVLTKERKLTYVLENNNLVLQASNGTAYPAVSLEGTYLPDYNTAVNGPLDGGYMSWLY